MRSALQRMSLALAVPLTVALLAPAAGAAPNDAASQRRVPVIVTLADGVAADQADDVARDHGANPTHLYRHALVGFSAEVPEGRLRGLQQDRRVRRVEADGIATTQVDNGADPEMPTGVHRIFAPASPTDGTGSQGVDADVAVIDTGIAAHPDLVIEGGVNCVTKRWFDPVECKADGYDDGNGHGTHVAGTIGALDDGTGVVGVAPGVRLWAVRVLDDRGSGTWSDVIAGIDWVAGQAATIEVANMSLGGGVSASVDAAVRGARAAGVVMVVAAGNDGKDASSYSPAREPSAVTVSALADFNGLPGGGAPSTCRTDVDDTFANFSNFGTVVDIIAPGVCIRSTWNNGGFNTISGTSMAAPHVAGAAALVASKTAGSGAARAQAIEDEVLSATNSNWINTDDGPDSEKEGLLDVGGITGVVLVDLGGTEDTNSPPTASFTYSCSDLSCTFDGTASDADGDLLTYTWTFGDGNTATVLDTSHTYASAATYTVTLTVSDGTADTMATRSVTVTAPSSGGLTLSATGYKIKGVQHADLSWSGATSTNVDVYRGGSVIATTTNDGTHTDNIGNKGGGSYTYKVCEAGTTTCSNEVTVTF